MLMGKMRQYIEDIIKEHFELRSSPLGDIDFDRWDRHCPIVCDVPIKDAIENFRAKFKEQLLDHIHPGIARLMFDCFRRAYITNNQDEFNSTHCITIKIKGSKCRIGWYLHQGLEFYMIEGLISLFLFGKEVDLSKDKYTFAVKDISLRTEELMDLIDKLFNKEKNKTNDN